MTLPEELRRLAGLLAVLELNSQQFATAAGDLSPAEVRGAFLQYSIGVGSIRALAETLAQYAEVQDRVSD